MMKKKLLLGALVASVFITSALCLNACKKNSDEDVIPTEVTVMRGANHFAVCAHCYDSINVLWDRNWYCNNPEGPHWALDDPRVMHVHEYMVGDECALVTHGGWCRYNKRHHMHKVYYEIKDNGEDHYQDDWIHIGGGGGGE